MSGTKLCVSVLLGQLNSSVKDLHQVRLILFHCDDSADITLNVISVCHHIYTFFKSSAGGDGSHTKCLLEVLFTVAIIVVIAVAVVSSVYWLPRKSALSILCPLTVLITFTMPATGALQR